MYFMYVDESGDTGITASPTHYFCLSSLVVHELRWQECLNQLIDFRRRMKVRFGLRMREEIHAAQMINRPGELVRIRRNDRLTIIRAFADELTHLPDVNVINVVVDKRPTDTSEGVFDRGWRALIQRFENTISNHNFPGPANTDDRGLIICDQTDARLNKLLRKLRRYNPVPNQKSFGVGYRDLRLKYIIEDPVHRDSRDTYFLQAADALAFLVYQVLDPSSYIRRRGARMYFMRLDPILCKVGSTANAYGDVRV